MSNTRRSIRRAEDDQEDEQVGRVMDRVVMGELANLSWKQRSALVKVERELDKLDKAEREEVLQIATVNQGGNQGIKHDPTQTVNQQAESAFLDDSSYPINLKPFVAGVAAALAVLGAAAAWFGR